MDETQSSHEGEIRRAATERLPTYDRLRKGKLLEDESVAHTEVDVTKLWMQDKVNEIASSMSSSGASAGSMEERQSPHEGDPKWAAIERLPTYDRLRKAMLRQVIEDGRTVHNEVDVTKLGMQDKRQLMDSLLKVVQEDHHESFLRRLRDRFDTVGIEIPKIEVRFDNLGVEGDVYVGSRAHPTLLNATLNTIECILGLVRLAPSKKRKIQILKGVSGIVKPSRMTLLLGPPGAGKTTLLTALAGKLDRDLRSTGKITYCGHELNEFIPQRTSAYVSEHDLHYVEMTVRETLDFSDRCLGVGTRYELLSELSTREKEARIKPDYEIDAFMKATAVVGQETSLVTEYILKILGLDICADIMIGDDMQRGISGGQKKRVTTGEMLVGPAKVLFMDEISTGLDSSTTFQICNCMRQMVHIMDLTILISLLQPAPETYELFDDIIVLSEGQIVYQGTRENVLDFFEYMGFKCPERKGVADFLQEATSKKDQEQYWFRENQPYKYVSVSDFVHGFSSFHIGQQLASDLRFPYDKSRIHPAALVTEKYGISNWELFKACFSREWLLMKRSSFVFIFKTFQITIMSLITMTVYLRTEMQVGTLADGQKFLGVLFFSLINVMFNGMAELYMIIFRLPVFYKQRDSLFYPSWAFSLPIWVLRIPLSALESGIWVALTYYTVGFAPAASRFFRQFLAFFGIHQMALSLFRFIAAVGRVEVVANTLGTLTLLLVFVLGGFVIAKTLGDSKAVVLNEDENKNPYSTGRRPEGINIHVKNSSNIVDDGGPAPRTGMVLPFQPLALAFNHINYYVDMPAEMKAQGIKGDRLQLLRDVSGAFRPGILTALVGVTGAGKTTLMDVLAGRKTGGYIEGNISISGYTKNQATFARVSGYCEQNDIHSPNVTVYESLMFSAWLRLSSDIDNNTRKMFIDEVMELIELKPLRDALVGLPGVDGLSIEQRKRLTIAVELIANPSIIFMDEPTSGLDARAAAIVMRTVRNTVDTGRTVVCTIHQPSIDIFEAFDDLMLMKRGGQVIYAGPLGHHSHELVEYFEAIQGVPKIRDGYNPATWMLEVSSPAVEAQLNVDFADIYSNSSLYQCNQKVIRELSTPAPGSKELSFPTKYSQPFLTQCRACFWKQYWSYWRNPQYNAIRTKEQDLLNLLGALYSAVFFLGANNASVVQSVVGKERIVFYRERAAGMYSELPYAFAQVAIEIIYTAIQALIYTMFIYSMIGFELTIGKFLWFSYYIISCFVYFNLYGMMVVALTPSYHIAGILLSFFINFWILFSGFMIPRTVRHL
ncbi:hypothetical protein REPUB_Repub06bG0158000 [Reevesia pubescens]